jgi:hypothetical protein
MLLEVYNHSEPFSRFLGCSGHKEMLSVKLPMCFMDSSWKVRPEGEYQETEGQISYLGPSEYFDFLYPPSSTAILLRDFLPGLDDLAFYFICIRGLP